ncbi:MAG: (Fe-S)-binding protein [Anaerolineales bacterium]|nr:(Fe-S)-binding protein [Anaerolineales bacterium]
MQTVQLFITCLIDTLEPQIGEAVVQVLERAGVNVAFPKDQTCCGQPAFNAGMWPEARKTAIHTIQVFEAAPGPVIIPSGSCAAMILHGYLELFADDPAWLPRAQALAERAFEFTEFLVDVLEITDLGARYPGLITYHPSCHLLRGLGVNDQPRTLLSNVGEAEYIELPHQDECCGFGGVFSVKHPEISAEMLKKKLENIQATNAPTVVVCDTGCLMHIGGGLHRDGKYQKVMHIAEILVRQG